MRCHVGSADDHHAQYEDHDRGVEAAGLRSQAIILVGGAPVLQAYANEIGADGYAPDACRRCVARDDRQVKRFVALTCEALARSIYAAAADALTR